MRNNIKKYQDSTIAGTQDSKISRIISLVSSLPYFTVNDLAGIEKNKDYLRVLLSRYQKMGKVWRLKKGMYATQQYLYQAEKSNVLNYYAEFLTNVLYSPSYLSLDYVLYQHNLLTEMPNNITAVSTNKTQNFSNKFGSFYYHSIKQDLFTGFEVIKQGDYLISKATKAKALFDYLYYRKHYLTNKKAVEQLRLNFDLLSSADQKELRKYALIEGTVRMKLIIKSIEELKLAEISFESLAS